jgi:hypothetical protein
VCCCRWWSAPMGRWTLRRFSGRTPRVWWRTSMQRGSTAGLSLLLRHHWYALVPMSCDTAKIVTLMHLFIAIVMQVV